MIKLLPSTVYFSLLNKAGPLGASWNPLMSHSPVVDNPTRAKIAQVVAAGLNNTAIDANPALIALDTQFVQGEPGQLTLRFTTPADALQGNGVVGGGVLAGMLDVAMALAILSTLPVGRTCTTINLNVSMLNAARPGQLVAEATVRKLGRSIAFAEASLFDAEKHQLIATASASFALLDVQR